MILADPARFKDVDLQGEVLRDWPVFSPFLNADKIINALIAKHHSLTGTTLGMKNWYGSLGCSAGFSLMVRRVWASEVRAKARERVRVRQELLKERGSASPSFDPPCCRRRSPS